MWDFPMSDCCLLYAPIHHLYKHLHVSISLYFSVSSAWGSICGKEGRVMKREGGACHHSGCAPVWSSAELPLWAKNTSGKRGQGREKERWRHEAGGKEKEWGYGEIVEGCRDGVESVVLRSVLYCALLLSPLLGIIRSMNISLITAEKAERRTRVTLLRLLTSPPPIDIATPHSSMSPALHVSPFIPAPPPFL